MDSCEFMYDYFVRTILLRSDCVFRPKQSISGSFSFLLFLRIFDFCRVCFFSLVFFFNLFNVVHGSTIPMVHAKSHATYKLDARHVLQQWDDEQLVLHELMAPNDGQQRANGMKHMVRNGTKWSEWRAFLSPNCLHLRPTPIVFQRLRHKWPPQKMQATQDRTVRGRWKRKKKLWRKINQNVNVNTFIHRNATN